MTVFIWTAGITWGLLTILTFLLEGYSRHMAPNPNAHPSPEWNELLKIQFVVIAIAVIFGFIGMGVGGAIGGLLSLF